MVYTRFGFIFLCFLLFLLAAAVWEAQPARAHAEYKRSEPMADAVIPAAPAEVQVWFAQELFRREGANTLEVFGPTGVQVDKKDARIDDDDRTHMTVSLQAGLPAGVYTVRWRTLSAEDGDPANGEFSFTVNSAAAQQTPLPSSGATPVLTTTTTTEPILTPTLSPVPTAAPAGQGGLPCLGGIVLGGLSLGLVVAPRLRSRGMA